MESYIKTPNTKRFVVEDSITKVTSDGEPHGMMTMIAVLSGLFAAIIILSILVSLVACKKHRRAQNCKSRLPTLHSIEKNNSDNRLSSKDSVCDSEFKCSALTGIYNKGGDFDETTGSDMTTRTPRTSTISMISHNELNLCDVMQKKKKQTHWQDEIKRSDAIAETTIDMKRY